jgi:hypothetical protein
MLVAFTGSYEQFRKQLKAAWVRMVWEETFKNDLEEQATHKRLLIPDWYKKGCILYFAEGWPLQNEEDLKKIFSCPPGNWQALIEEHASLAGQAFCYFLSEKFREDACKQILFQMNGGKSLARAARLITKHSLNDLTAACFAFYQKRFAGRKATLPAQDSFIVKIKKAWPKEKIFEVKENPDKKTIAWIAEKNNRRRVYIQNRKEPSHRKKVARYALPPWISNTGEDPYPLLQWDDKGQILFITVPEKGMIKVRKYTATRAALDFRDLYGVDGVRSFAVWDRNQWLLSAFRKGKSDMVLYDAQRLRYKALTDDMADNMEGSFLKEDNDKVIAYRSGFPADSLWHKDSLAKPYGIYMKSISGALKKTGEAKEILIAKDSAYIQWHQPVLLRGNKIALQNTRNGIIETDTFSLSHLPVQNSKSKIQNPPSPWLKAYLQKKKEQDSLAALEQKREANNVSVLGKILHPGKDAAVLQKDSLRKALAYAPGKIKPYILQLYRAYFSAGINNDYYINRYQPFKSYLGSFNFPEVGAMVQGGFSDLFENHHFNIGYRMPTATEGSDFIFRYGNTARKLDWHVLYFRKVESLEPDPGRNWKDPAGRTYPAAAKVKTEYYELGFHLPLTYDMSVNFLAAARNDRTIFLATDKYSLDFEDIKQWWSLNTLSFDINKTHPLPVLFLKKGWAAKLLTDGMIELEKPSTILYGVQLKVKDHLPLFKGINLVTQLQLGYSGGESHILYNFGGTDNNIVPRVDSSVSFEQNAPYAFQALVTPFRGYPQNSLYGNSFGLLNVDLYVPLFAKLIPLQTSFASLNELQLGAFTDIATAAGPGAVNQKEVNNTLISFGLSARTILAGYPIRFDLAWPGSFDKKPLWYLSLSL